MQPPLANLVAHLERAAVVHDARGDELYRNAAAGDGALDTTGWEAVAFVDEVVRVAPRSSGDAARHRILAEASRALTAGFGEPFTALQAIVDLAVREFCSLAFVDTIGEGRHGRRIQAHRDAGHALLATARDLAPEPGSTLFAPLVVQNERVGVLVLVRARGEARFDEEDLALATELAYRASQAIEISGLHTALARSEARLRRLVDADMVGVLNFRLDGTLVDANRCFLQMLGYEDADGLDLYALTPPACVEADERARDQLRRARQVGAYEKAYLHRRGHEVPVQVASALFPDSDDEGIQLVLDLTRQKRVEDRLRLLADASEVLYTTADERAALQRIARLLVPALCDVCVLDLVRGDRVERVAVAHRNRDEEPAVLASAERWPLAVEQERFGVPALIREVADEDLVRYARSPEHLEALRARGFRSMIVAPLLLHEQVLGSLSLYVDTDRPCLEPADLELTLDLARRLAIALERSRLTAELRQSESTFRAVVEATPQLTFAAAADGTVTFVNQRWSEYTGTTLDDFAVHGWRRLLHPDDVARARERWTRGHREGRVDAQVRLRRHDGRFRWFLVRAVATRTDTGAVTRWLGTCTDIDEAHRTQEQADLLASASAALTDPSDPEAALARLAVVPVPRFAESCAIYLCDERSCRLAHLHHRDPELARRSRAVHEALPLTAADAHGWPRVLRTGESEIVRTSPELLCLASDPVDLEVIRVACTLVVPIKADQDVLGVISFASRSEVYDEDDVRAAEEVGRRAALFLQNARLYALAQSERARAEEANRLKDGFLAMLSHELRTPLSALAGWVQLIRRGRIMPERFEHAMTVIDRNARSLGQLIDDLLDVSRIVTGNLRLEPQVVDFGPVVEAAVDAVRPAAREKGVAIELELVTVPELTGDPERLKQVVWNLLSNAVKFTPAGGRVAVVLTAGIRELVLQVTDTGAGIDPRFLPYLFDPFRQADDSSTRAHGGLGLGLAIVKHLVEAHGGTVQPHSDGVGRGARFVVRLPVRSGISAPAPPRAPTPPARLDGVRVLVVEDDPDTRELLSTLLTLAGARVDQVGSAAEARAALVRTRPDLIVSDIGMPDEDGLSLMRSIRATAAEDGGAIPSIALTAFATAADRQRALRAGFHEHAAKPVDPDVLVELIRSVHLSAREPG